VSPSPDRAERATNAARPSGVLRSVRRRRTVAVLGVLMVLLFVLVELLLFRSYAQTERTTQDFKTTTDATTAVANALRETSLLGQAVVRLSSGDSVTPVMVRRGLLERQLDVVQATVVHGNDKGQLGAIKRDLGIYDRAFAKAYGRGERARPGPGRAQVERELAALERRVKEYFDEQEHALYDSLASTLDERAAGQRLVVGLSVFALLLAAALAWIIGRAIRGDFARAYAALAAEAKEREALGEKLFHQAMHDPLTRLGNRLKFQHDLEMSLREQPARTAVLYVDLDGFKAVNDAFGHDAGDELLCEVARGLTRCIRPGDELARLGGDEFAVLMSDVHERSEVAAVGERLLIEIGAAARPAGRASPLGASVGAAIGRPELEDAQELIAAADLAMYAAKQQGKGAVRFFEPAMQCEAAARSELERELSSPLSRGEFELHYQPIVELATERLRGVEALIRWRHPDRGLLAPVEFLQIAEDSGQLVAIGRWVLHEACRQAASWPVTADGAQPWVSVNLSPEEILAPGLAEHVSTALRDTGLDPCRLVLEISERTTLDAARRISATLARLRELGVRIALDDFGTGSTSLSTLRFLSIEIVKLDKSFIDSISCDPEAHRLAAAVLDLAHALGLETVAEGIEQADQIAHLSQMQCTLGQGYHISKPVPATHLSALLGSSAPPGHETHARTRIA
jgi:diguanylate cyclase (GGDEF)-like protein